MIPLTAAIVGSSAAQAQGDNLCRPGQRLEVVDYGKWNSAVVIGVRDETYAPCRVHRIGYETTLDAWVPLSYLRPTGGGVVAPIPGGPKAYDATLDSIARHGAPVPVPTRVALGHYGCVTFSGSQLISSGEFTINGATAYSSGGGSGTYAYDGKTGLIKFHGSTWDGQSAKYEDRPRPRIHVLGARGGYVMDCDGPER
ncbi:MAG: hypothetical protein M3081_10805 [Gemmatimonadota bacterium]|nr:hypothetical protein [Gemmatimonadota bacterium]